MYTVAEQNRLYQLTKKLLSPAPSEEPNEQIFGLREVIRYHEWRYYILNDPVISDYEYDQLFKHLEKLEKENPSLVTEDSPTKRVSPDLIDEFNSVLHFTPMLSLANSYDQEDLLEFDRQLHRLLGLDGETDLAYGVEPKFDGGTIVLVYENDVLVRGATRGDGVRGEEITKNIRTVKTIPLTAAFSCHGLRKVELRGEAIIKKSVFKKVNTEREKQGLPLFANPRNSATGGLRMKDPKETALRGLEAFIYQVNYVEWTDGSIGFRTTDTHSQFLSLLWELGFMVPKEERKLCNNIREVIEFCNHWAAKRDDYAYEIDGMVIKLNRMDLQERAGYTSHHPRWAIAYKFQAKQSSTRLLAVEFQVGKVGSITPVGKLEPMPLAGVTVSSVSLHNEEFIRSKDIRIGDAVIVERAGDVIPYIVKSQTDLRTGLEQIIQFPSHCPVCQSLLVKEADEAAWRCPNTTGCEAQLLQRLIHHASKDAMDIEGLGRSTIERFYQLGWLNTLADIYRLDYGAIAQLEGMGLKSAQNLQSGIDKAKNNPIHRLLFGLSIHHLGKRAAALLAQSVDHVLDLQEWDMDRLMAIKDIGPVLAQNVVTFFNNPQNIALLEELEDLGVNLKQTEEDKPKIVPSSAPLAGKTILFTGTLTSMDRKKAEQLAVNAGAKLLSAVSSNLSILVVGEQAGAKLDKASALGTVQILTEREYITMIEG